MGLINCLSSLKADLTFLATTCDIKPYFFFVRLTDVCGCDLHFGYILSTKDSKIPSATPRNVALGTINVSLLELANTTYAQRIHALVSELIPLRSHPGRLVAKDSIRDNAGRGVFPQ